MCLRIVAGLAVSSTMFGLHSVNSMLCVRCGDGVPDKRYALGFVTCLKCGEYEAKQVRHCVVPMNKSNYIVVSDIIVLSQLNPKRVM